jgi:hypothetical protein
MSGVVGLLLGALGTAFAQGEDIPLTDGHLWQLSSHVEKTAYLIGAGNFLAVEYVVQQQSDSPPTDEQSSIRQFWDGLEDESLDDLINAVDRFYRDNPDEMEDPVLVVIWNTFIETD